MELVNQAVCDLRLYNSPKAMGTISKIKNAALLLIPKDMDDETRAAYAAIEKKNVATEIEVDADCSPLTSMVQQHSPTTQSQRGGEHCHRKQDRPPSPPLS